MFYETSVNEDAIFKILDLLSRREDQEITMIF